MAEDDPTRTTPDLPDYSVAVHEAAHAVCAAISGTRFESVSLIPGTSSLGHVMLTPIADDDEITDARILSYAVSTLAGLAADFLISHTAEIAIESEPEFSIIFSGNGGVASDVDNIEGLAKILDPKHVAIQVFRWISAAIVFCHRHQQDIIAIANALLEHGTLTEAEVLASLKHGVT